MLSAYTIDFIREWVESWMDNFIGHFSPFLFYIIMLLKINLITMIIISITFRATNDCLVFVSSFSTSKNLNKKCKYLMKNLISFSGKERTMINIINCKPDFCAFLFCFLFVIFFIYLIWNLTKVNAECCGG